MPPDAGPTEVSMPAGERPSRWAGFEAYLLDQVQAAVIATDLEGTVTHWNRHAEALFGWTAEEAWGRHIGDLMVLPRDEAEAGDVMEKLRAGESWAGEFVVPRKDGSTVLCYVRDSPILDPEGQVVGMVGVSVDITERKRAEQRVAARTAVTRVLAEAPTVAEAVPRVLQSVAEKLGWRQGVMWRLDRGADVLRSMDMWPTVGEGGEFARVTREIEFPRGVGLPGRVWATGQAAWIPDVAQDDNFPRASYAAREGLHAAFGFPILLGGEVLGVIEFFSEQILEPDDDLLQTMNVIGSQMGQFMERKQAEEAVFRSDAMKSAILRGALDCVITMDHRGLVVEMNPAAERTFGYRREDVIGKEMASLIIPSQYRERHRQGLARYLETGEGNIVGQRVELSGMRADGTEFPLELAITRVDLPGPPTFTGYIRDITERKQAEDALRESRDQLQTIFQGVSEGITVQNKAGRLIYANEAAASLIGYPSAEELLEAPVQEVLARFDILDDQGDLFPLEELPGRVALQGQSAEETVLCFREKGGHELRWSSVKASPVFDEFGSVRFAVTIFHDITERKRDEDAQRLLAEASGLFSSSLNHRVLLRKLAQLAVPRLADWCSVDMLEEDGSTSQLAVAHVDPAKVEWAKELRERYPPDPTEPGGVPEVIRTGRSALYPDIPDAMLVQAAVDDEHLEILRSLGIRSVMMVPLVARGVTLGAITLVSAESGRTYGPEDLPFAEQLASRAALAVDNARLYQEQSSVARALQQSLLPPQLPDIPGVELARAYRPAGRGNQVGGDFYDVFALGDGTWALVIGDVCGKGPSAAAVTGLARHTLRAAAMQERRPSRMLAALNEAVIQQRSDNVFCTVAMGRLRTGPKSNGRPLRLTLCCAGHPLPIVLRADGTVEPAGAPGMLLGFFPDPELTDRPVDLSPGDTLVLFTDGVTEERGAGEMFGRERLESVLRACAGKDAGGIVEALERAIEEFQPEAPRDDIAILVAKVQG